MPLAIAARAWTSNRMSLDTNARFCKGMAVWYKGPRPCRTQHANRQGYAPRQGQLPRSDENARGRCPERHNIARWRPLALGNRTAPERFTRRVTFLRSEYGVAMRSGRRAAIGDVVFVFVG